MACDPLVDLTKRFVIHSLDLESPKKLCDSENSRDPGLDLGSSPWVSSRSTYVDPDETHYPTLPPQARLPKSRGCPKKMPLFLSQLPSSQPPSSVAYRSSPGSDRVLATTWVPPLVILGTRQDLGSSQLGDPRDALTLSGTKQVSSVEIHEQLVDHELLDQSIDPQADHGSPTSGESPHASVLILQRHGGSPR